MSEDISKLPKWAQIRIARLERDLTDTQRLISEMGETADTNVRWSSGLMDRHNLPNNSQIEYIINGKAIDISIREHKLRISTQRTLKIYPSASNSILISNEED